MKKFFINYGNWQTGALTLPFFIMPDLLQEHLPEFSNKYLTMITYLIIVFLTISLSVYYKKN
tara:strand:- start:265 stop:450 length:186 start_codon:yes stop_codon:yes gene_type:complete